MRDMAKYDNV